MEQKNITEYNIIELKAIAYDQIVAIEQAQTNLRLINQELQRKNQELSQNATQPTSFTGYQKI